MGSKGMWGGGLGIISVAKPALVLYLDDELGGADWNGRLMFIILTDLVTSARIELMPVSALWHVVNNDKSKFIV